ncbi:MAG: YgiQ family radical SAM protein [Candidatus Izimaplasma sp.]|nr:YgiQ family radical SAM protein [Candidatus Izimaplasma bacterium]
MFLPINHSDLEERNIEQLDFIIISGDAYIDHPSFGVAIISRKLEAHGYRVGIIAQPNINKKQDFKKLGTPRLGFLITAGNIDSMVNHYSVSKRRRKKDQYSPGGEAGLRPDYATIKYGINVRKIFPHTPIIIGGIEASLRRLAHYDYWSNEVRKSILIDAKADLLIYGMSELSMIEVADSLNSGIDVRDICFIKGTVFKAKEPSFIPDNAIELPTYDTLLESKKAYAESYMIQYNNTDYHTANPLVEKYNYHTIVQMPPNRPLTQFEMDQVYNLPYERTYHPIYKKLGHIPAINEVKFSIIANRGCYGGCSFCALTNHQGRVIQSRSKNSIIKEAKQIISEPDFKGYIHDVGGPTANFYDKACDKQLTKGVCQHKQCIGEEECSLLKITHKNYLSILRDLRDLEGVKKVFIRSGIRYDYLLHDEDDTFFKELVKHHISGQLKVAPEHISDNVLHYMNKPRQSVYNKFVDKYNTLNKHYDKNQFLVPYLMSSHPGSTLKDAIELAEYVRDLNYYPKQVQDFYPTPGTLATTMYYTGLDPRTMETVYVPKTRKEKAMQRALIQFKNPKNYQLVHDALIHANRPDLIGHHKLALIRPKRY